MNEEQARPVVERRLRRVAAAGETIAYSKVADEVGWAHRALGKLSGKVVADEDRAGSPLLTAVVVRKDTGALGDGFLGMAKSLGGCSDARTSLECWREELRKVHDYWGSRARALPWQHLSASRSGTTRPRSGHLPRSALGSPPPGTAGVRRSPSAAPWRRPRPGMPAPSRWAAVRRRGPLSESSVPSSFPRTTPPQTLNVDPSGQVQIGTHQDAVPQSHHTGDRQHREQVGGIGVVSPLLPTPQPVRADTQETRKRPRGQTTRLLEPCDPLGEVLGKAPLRPPVSLALNSHGPIPSRR